MITLTFRAFSDDSMTLVRGTYFTICSDGTLRGPDYTVAAIFAGGIWHVARRRHRVLECGTAVFLRIMTSAGRRKNIGPCERLKITGGEVFANDVFLGAHMREKSFAAEIDIWRDIAILSDV